MSLCIKLPRVRRLKKWVPGLMLVTIILLLLLREDVYFLGGGGGRDDRYEYPSREQERNYRMYGPKERLLMSNKKLRILPLGDSITEGTGSSTGDGYRAVLFNILTQHDNEVSMVGSRTTGFTREISHEGWGGFETIKVADMSAAWGTRPNVITLLAGTNDAVLYDDMPLTARQLDNLIGALFEACPDATILIGKLIPSLDLRVNANAKVLNRKITTYVRRRARQGQHVVLVDLSVGFDPELDFTDELHPNDQGYDRIAHAWAGGLDLAVKAGWVGMPVYGPFRILEYVFFGPDVLNIPWGNGTNTTTDKPGKPKGGA